jgi:AcrR family transcriptional regulator
LFGLLGSGGQFEATDAGVSVETVYKAFSNKAGLLKALFDQAVAGDDSPVEMAERDVIRQIAAEPDPVRKIAGYCQLLAETMPRAAPLQLLARAAAAADPGAAAVWAQTRQETLTAMTLFARNLYELAGCGCRSTKPATCSGPFTPPRSTSCW